jgi:hypothetical protein
MDGMSGKCSTSNIFVTYFNSLLYLAAKVPYQAAQREHSETATFPLLVREVLVS